MLSDQIKNHNSLELSLFGTAKIVVEVSTYICMDELFILF